MPCLASLLSFGYDIRLLETRESIFANAGFDIVSVKTPDDLGNALRSKRYALLLVCHSVPLTERIAAYSLAAEHAPHLGMLALVSGSSNPCTSPPEVNVSQGPTELIAKVRLLVRERISTSTASEENDMAQHEGSVKWFNNAKGYGFVGRSDGGSDVFTHYSSIQNDGYKTLKEGDSVTFDIIQGEKGLQADQVRVKNVS